MDALIEVLREIRDGIYSINENVEHLHDSFDELKGSVEELKESVEGLKGSGLYDTLSDVCDKVESLKGGLYDFSDVCSRLDDIIRVLHSIDTNTL
jgi:predicted nuclease with TOPRIM domain